MNDRLLFGRNLASAGWLMGRYVGSALTGKVRIRDRQERLGFFTRNIAKYTRSALGLFNFDIQVIGYDSELMRTKNFLLISNHMSYIDILVLSSIQPCVFVTSVDMGEQFFLGDMAELGGSIFIERRHRGQIEHDIGVMADTLRAGHNVVIYPEGTSSNGERVLPFKKSLLMSAVRAGVDIMPICVKYTEINHEPFSIANRDKVCWYGDMTFLPHMLGLMSLKQVKVELHFLKPIPVKPDSTRAELSDHAYAAISAAYGQPLGPVGAATN